MCQIKKGLLWSLSVKSRALSSSVAACWPGAQGARDNHLLACPFAKYSPILIFFTGRLNNKTFGIWLLASTPHIKYVAIHPVHYLVIYRQSLFSGFSVSHGSVATCARCGGAHNNHYTANSFENLLVKEFWKPVKIDRIIAASLVCSFLGPPCTQ